MKPRYKMIDVAREAGVSIATVSNVINNRAGRVGEETVARVREAIKKLDFRPNAAARQLKTGEMPMLGLLVPSIANPFYSGFALELEQVARRQGFGLLLCNTRRDPKLELEYANALLDQGVRGVVLGAALRAQDGLPMLQDRGLALLGFDRYDTEGPPRLDSVSMDNFAAARMATEHLFALGHRRIAFFTGAVTSANRVARLAGYRAACEAQSVKPLVLEAQSETPFTEMQTLEIDAALAEKLLSSERRVSGVVTMNDIVAIGLLSFLHSRGRPVPAQLSVVGIDNIPLAEVCAPRLTTVAQPLSEMAERAVTLLVDRIRDPRRPFEQCLFMPKFVQRDSDARCAAPESRRVRRS